MVNAVLKIDFKDSLRCKIFVENASKYINGIDDILIDFKTQTIKISFDESKSKALDQLRNIVKEIGHEAELIDKYNKTTDPFTRGKATAG